MRLRLLLAWAAVSSAVIAGESTVVQGLKNPESVVVAPDGKIYMTVMNAPDKPGDGSLVMVDKTGKITVVATGMDEPKGLVATKDAFYAADLTRIWKIDAASGKLSVHVPASAFPRPSVFLNDLDIDADGNLYVTDSGDKKGKFGAIFRIETKRHVTHVFNGKDDTHGEHRITGEELKVTQVFDAEKSDPKVVMPNGVLVEDPDHLLLADMGAGILYRLDVKSGKLQTLAAGLGGPDGIAKDAKGRIFVGDWKGGSLFQVDPNSMFPLIFDVKLQSAADISLTKDGREILVPDMKAGTLTWFPIPLNFFRKL